MGGRGSSGGKRAAGGGGSKNPLIQRTLARRNFESVKSFMNKPGAVLNEMPVGDRIQMNDFAWGTSDGAGGESHMAKVTIDKKGDNEFVVRETWSDIAFPDRLQPQTPTTMSSKQVISEVKSWRNDAPKTADYLSRNDRYSWTYAKKIR